MKTFKVFAQATTYVEVGVLEAESREAARETLRREGFDHESHFPASAAADDLEATNRDYDIEEIPETDLFDELFERARPETALPRRNPCK